MEERIEAKDVLKLAGISRATLTRWMDDEWVAGRGLSAPFPLGELRDGKTKVWRLSAVEQWLEENAQKLGRHRSIAPRVPMEGQTVTLPLDQALHAAISIAEEKGLNFDIAEQIASIEAELAKVLREKGVSTVSWNGKTFDCSFDLTPKGNEDRVLFLLAYS